MANVSINENHSRAGSGIPGMIDWSHEVQKFRSDSLESNDLPSHLLPAVGSQLEDYRRFLLLQQDDAPKQAKKQLILETRNALRLTMSLLAVHDDQIRQSIQNQALVHVEPPLSRLLSSPKGDAKCRLYAARVLCNMVTSNSETAVSMMDQRVPLSPSKEMVEQRTLRLLEEADEGEQDDSLLLDEPSWFDFLRTAALTRDREALAAIVAALYNAVVAVDSDDIYNRLATSSLLVSTLLRQLIAAESVTDHCSSGGGKDDDTTRDDATEWIILLVGKLCCHGQLKDLYEAVGGASKKDATTTMVVPEQVVLLRCVQETLHQSSSSSLHDDFSQHTLSDILLFLGRIFGDIRQRWLVDATNDVALESQALLSCLDICCDLLGTDASLSLRVLVGERSSLLQDAGRTLGNLYDRLVARNAGKKVRDQVIHEDEKKLLNSSVRFIGNACYKCRPNQDVLRSTLVPPPKNGSTAGDTTRNVLHVLLSCTSFAYICFGLREWAVIAIRNALEDNVENQTIVAELEAQQAVQSETLNDMGIRVDLTSNGKVKVVPLDPVPEHSDDSA